jgi:hypothetical protein
MYMADFRIVRNGSASYGNLWTHMATMLYNCLQYIIT